MNILPRSAFLLMLAALLSGCLFNEPIFKDGLGEAVFRDGLAKADPSLAGVWATDDGSGDPRKIEFAVCAPLESGAYLLHHPAGKKDGIYYEARPLKIRERTLMQLRVIATFDGGVPKTDTERYTLIWLEKDAAGQTIRVRALGGEGVKEKGPAQVKALLEKADSEWPALFGDAETFRRCKDEQP